MGLGVLNVLYVVACEPCPRRRGDEALASAQRTRRSSPASRIDLTNVRVLQPIDPLEVGGGHSEGVRRCETGRWEPNLLEETFPIRPLPALYSPTFREVEVFSEVRCTYGKSRSRGQLQ